jgi:murein DD-endopeptidase MepM/ murein hydrolase activator NlpD
MIGMMFALALQTASVEAPRPKFTPPPKARAVDGMIEQIELSPLYRSSFTCTEHFEGQLDYAGDALGTDCLIIGGIDEEGNGFSRVYRTDGRTNADWYGWGADVLAPFDGAVEAVLPNKTVNEPGTLGKPPAGMIRFQRADGTLVVYGHVADVLVKPGDEVKAGQVVAKVGNNGFSRSPHIHVGAYRGDVPLQIRWDLRAMGKLMAPE